MKPPKETAQDLFNENYMIFADLDSDLSEEALISALSIKFAIKEWNAILKALSPVDYAERKYYKDIIDELMKM